MIIEVDLGFKLILSIIFLILTILFYIQERKYLKELRDEIKGFHHSFDNLIN